MRAAKRKITSVSAALAVAAGVWACASSGGGISGTSIVVGPIAGFGSIVVNDVEFDTSSAVVTIEGDAAEISDLQLGMFVFVRGVTNPTTQRGIAERVASDHVLEGPVDGVDTTAGTFSALGQLVITDAGTVFAQTSLVTLAAGDVVEVFGVRDADESIRATRVERKTGVTEYEVTGTISGFDATAMTFDVGLLHVDFRDALIEDAPPSGLADGLLVEVETDEAPVADAVTATGVQVLDPTLMFEDGDGAEVQGFVTAVVSSSEFVLNGSQPVQTTAATRYENGAASDLVLNARVEVEGALDAFGVVIAEEIEFLAVVGP